MIPSDTDSIAASTHHRERPPVAEESPLPIAGGELGLLRFPSELEREHQRLIHLLSEIDTSESTNGLERTDQSATIAGLDEEVAPAPGLLESIRRLISRGCQLGVFVEDPSDRGECQRILNYWAIYFYRLCQEEIPSHLLPFDRTQAPGLDEDSFPYQFEVRASPRSGWRRLLDECEQRLSSSQFLAVVGDNGSGRSILTKKVLVPMLKCGGGRLKEFADSANWRFYHVSAGEHWLGNLARAIAPEDATAVWLTEQEAAFRRDDTALQKLLVRPEMTPIVIVVDELEVLLSAPEVERKAFLQNLFNLLLDGEQTVYVITTLRRDYAAQSKRFGPFESLLREGQVLLAFTTAELRRFIEEPAKEVGLVFDRGLVDQVLIDIQGEPTALPLLQFTLTRLWPHRLKNRITWEGYNLVGAGQKSLKIAAEELYQTLDESQQKTLQSVLLALVLPEPGSTFRTCELSRDDLHRRCGNIEPVDALIDRLLEANLLEDCSHTSTPRFRIRYVALLSAWPLFVGWLNDLQLRHRRLLRLRQDAQRWHDRSRPNDLLWRGILLTKEQGEIEESSLTKLEQDFLRISRWWDRVWRWGWRGVGIAIAALLLLMFVQREMAIESDRQRVEAKGQVIEAERKRIKAAGELAAAKVELATNELKLSQAEVKLKEAVIEHRVEEDKYKEDLAKKRDADRMLRDAMNAMKSGDVSGGMSWLSARRSILLNLSKLQDREDPVDPQRRQIAARQLPNLHQMSFAKPKAKVATAGTPDSQDELGFGNLAVSKDGNILVAALTGKSRLTGKMVSRNLRILGLNGAPEFTLSLPSPSQDASESDASNADVAFRGDGDLLFVLSGDLFVWTLADLTTAAASGKQVAPEFMPHKFKPLDGRRPPDIANLSLLDGSRNPHGLLLTSERTKGRPHGNLRIWAVTAKQTEIELEEMKPGFPTDFVDVHFATMNERGNLIAILRGPQDGPRKLQIWKSDDADKWQTIAVPDWAVGQHEDRGWTASKHTEDGREENYWEKGGESFIRYVAFCPSSNKTSGKNSIPETPSDLLVTASDDGEVNFWGISGTSPSNVVPQLEKTIRLGAAVFHVSFRDERTLVTGCRDRTTRLWDVHSRRELCAPFFHEGTVVENAFMTVGRNEKRLVTNTAEVLRVWDLPTPAPNQALTCSSISVDLSSSTQRLSGEAALQLLSHLKDIETHEEPPVEHAVVGGTGELLAYAGADTRRVEDWMIPALGNSQRLVDLVEKLSPALMDKVKDARINYIAFSNQARLLAVVGGKDGKGLVFVCRVETPASTRWIDLSKIHEEPVLFAAFSQDNSLLVTTDVHDYAMVWKVNDLLDQMQTTPEPVAKLKHTTDVIAAGFGQNIDGKRQLVTVSSEGEASVWVVDPTSTSRVAYQPKRKFVHDAKIRFAAFNDAGDFLVTASQDRTARIWHVASGELVGVLPHAEPVLQAWFLSDNAVLTMSGQGKRDVVARYWPLNSPDITPDKTKLQFLSARRVSDDKNRLQTLDIKELQDRWRNPATQ